MPTYRMKAPDGQTYQVEGPEGATDEQVRAEIIKQNPSLGGAQQKDRAPQFDVGAGVILPSAAGVAKSMAEPFIHPQETYEGFKGLAKGVLEKSGLKESAGNEKYVDALVDHYKDRYGSVANAKKTFETDPVGFLADASIVFTGGGSALARAPGIIGKVGEVARTVGAATDPLNVASKAAGAAYRGGVAPLLGVTTGTGGEALRSAEQAGRAGGAEGQAFRDAIGGRTDPRAVRDEAQQALDRFKQVRQVEYRLGMIPTKQDRTILSWNDVDTAINEAKQIGTFKGAVTNKAAVGVTRRMEKIVNDWKQQQASQFWTPEGFDALKQKLGEVVDATDEGSRAQKAGTIIYNGVRDAIVKHAPQYADTMKGYEKATEQIREIEKTLSLNKNASIDSSLRKLLSALRDNVNTNFGQRRTLVEFLQNYGAPNLMARLSGMALRPGMPHGLSRLLAGTMAEMGLLSGAGAMTALKAAPALASLSPRLMGEGAYGLGVARRGAESMPGRMAGQAERLAGGAAEQLNPREITRYDAKQALIEKKDAGYTDAEIKILRQAARPNATADTLLRARQIMQRRQPNPLQITVRPQQAQVPPMQMPQSPQPTPGLQQTPMPGQSSYQGPME